MGVSVRWNLCGLLYKIEELQAEELYMQTRKLLDVRCRDLSLPVRKRFNNIFIYCNWVVTRWQWLFYTYTKYEIGYY